MNCFRRIVSLVLCLTTTIAAGVAAIPGVYADDEFSIASINALVPGYSEKIVYTSGSSDGVEYICDAGLTVSDGRVYADDGIAAGKYSVTASNGNCSNQFSVTVFDLSNIMGINGNNEFVNRVDSLQKGVESFEHDDGELTLFVGDSYFDERMFYYDFYSRFAGKNAYTVGINTSSSESWYWWAQKLVIAQNPKNIVMHIGPNDIFVNNSPARVTANSIIALFEEIHENLPDTPIYWLTIELRTSQNETYKHPVIEQTNALITEYAEKNPWVKIVDMCSALKKPNGALNYSLYRDNVHVRCPEGYDLMMKLLADAGLEISDNSHGIQIADRTTEQQYGWFDSSAITNAFGRYIYETDVTVNSYGESPFISFLFNGDNSTKFHIWDNENNAHMKYGGIYNGETVAGTNFTDISTDSGKVFHVKIFADSEKAYLYINGVLEATYDYLPKVNYMTVSSENCSVTFANTAVTRAGDANADGKVNALDALLTLKNAVGQTELNDELKTLCDVNSDSSVDSVDALNILQYSVKSITGFKAVVE